MALASQKDFSTQINSFIERSKRLGIVNFVHDITFGKGEISMLMNDNLMSNFFINHQVPVAFTNDSGRTLKDGLYINQTLSLQSKEHSILIANFFRAAKKFGLNYGNQVFHVAVNEGGVQHLYSLFFNLPQQEFLHSVINNGALIKDLLSQYQLQFNDLIQEVKKEEYRTVLPTSENIYQPLAKSQYDLATELSLTHIRTGFQINLSPQRSQCLYYLCTGESAKGIAKIMNLSPKTIEYYLGLLRKELGCKTSKELVASYYYQVNFAF